MKKFLIILLLFLSSLHFCGAQDAEVDGDEQSIRERLLYFDVSPQEIKDIFVNFQNAVRRDDAAAISEMIRFPLVVSIRGAAMLLEKPEHFIANYDHVFNKSVKHAVLAQKYESLFVNWKGIMIDRGQVWFDIDGKISCINNRVEQDIASAAEEARADEGGPAPGVQFYEPQDREPIELADLKNTEIFIAMAQENPSLLTDDYNKDENLIFDDVGPGYFNVKIGEAMSCSYELYFTDVNNDGKDEYIVTFIHSGSGNYSGVTGVYAPQGSGLKEIPFAEIVCASFNIGDMSKFHGYLGTPFLFKKNGNIFMNFDGDNTTYFWVKDKINLIGAGALLSY